MFLAHDISLAKWLSERAKLSANNMRYDIGRWTEDSLAIALGYTTALYHLLHESFVHGDPHSANIFIPLRNSDEFAVDHEWREIIIPHDPYETGNMSFKAYTANVKFIDSGSSEHLDNIIQDIHPESIDRETNHLRQTMLDLLTPKDTLENQLACPCHAET